MAKSRLYEFAKSLGLESKEVVSIASACGLGRRISPSSTLDEEEKVRILTFIQDRSVPKQPEKTSTVVIRKAKKGEGLEVETPAVSQPSGPKPQEAEGEKVAQEIEKEVSVGEPTPKEEKREQVESLRKEEGEGEPIEPSGVEPTLEEKREPAFERGSLPQADIPKESKPQKLEQVSEGTKEKGALKSQIPSEEEAKKKEKKWVDLKKEAPKELAGKLKKRIKPSKIEGDTEVAYRAPEDLGGDDETLEAPRIPLRQESLRKHQAENRLRRPSTLPPSAQKRVVRMDGTVTVGELAKQMGVKASELLRKLIDYGVMANVNQPLDSDTAQLIAGEFRYSVENHEEKFDDGVILEKIRPPQAKEFPRPPVVTIMGHVDHGKTTLLDAIRKSRVAENEAGGITQHIGAYTVETEKGRVTFLDTPGHEAFTAMRARGAKVTDVSVLVVAADDGIMPQTIEAINHAKAANVPIIVAINKIDKPEANPDRVKQSLMDYGLVPDDWGGNTVVVPLSAKTGKGLDDLLELLLLQTELLELKARREGPAVGAVIESRMDPKRGPLATVLVQEGTLRVGDYTVIGSSYGKVRALISDKGERLKEATPSIPVEILGLGQVPQAGELFFVMPDEKEARRIAQKRLELQKAQDQSAITKKVTLEDLYERVQKGDTEELNVILKADTDGTVEALKKGMASVSHEKVRLNIVHAIVGNISESDVMLASASNAIIVGFNVKADRKVLDIAQREGVSVRVYNVIYDLLEDLKEAIAGQLKPELKEVLLGQAEIRKVFSVSKVGNVAGAYVTKGKLVRNAQARLIRKGAVVIDSKISSLKRFKEDVREVAQGYDCGVNLEGFEDYQEGDMIEAYTLEEQAVTI